MRKTRKQLLESRIRDIKRQMLHQHDSNTRQIWKNHIIHLEMEISQINS